MKYNSVEILGYPVFSGILEDLTQFEDQTIINTLNAFSYAVAKKDDPFRTALSSSTILLPDGFPVVLAAKLLKKVTIHKIAGADLFFHLLKKAETNSLKCFFLGSNDDTLTKIIIRLKDEYPGIRAGIFSPPFVNTFSQKDSNAMINAVNHSSPDILFVGMTAPKQEKWVYEYKNHLNAKAICSIGAVFDFYAGTVKRPSKFWIYMKMEWFIRFLKEPRRLWKRYFIYSPIFFFDLLTVFLRRSKIQGD
jgi:N-acetylglucosaminyldiphosphoundecaprenol N-acetyl-beta-D-mannosaminyltransferase